MVIFEIIAFLYYFVLRPRMCCFSFAAEPMLYFLEISVFEPMELQ
jgi:hypothetical protein